MKDGPPVEVLGQGPEPDRGRPPRGPMPAGLRAASYVAAVAVATGALWFTASRHAPTTHPGPAPSSTAESTADALAQTQTVYPSPDFATLPARHDLTVSPVPGQHSFIAFSTHILLFLHLTYTGPAPVRLVDGRVPQGGAYPDDGAGGLTAGTTENVPLRAGIPTEVFVRTRVACPQVLAGEPVDHLDLVTQATGDVPRSQIVDLRVLGAYWDEARHAACSRADAAQALTVGIDVAAMVGSPAHGGGRPWVGAALSLHNSAGFEAVAVLSRASPPGLSLTAPALTTTGADVDGGSTFLAPLRWVVLDCTLARASAPPELDFQVAVSDSRAQVRWAQDAAFAAAWRIALGEACG
jgi:hypothetical protein